MIEDHTPALEEGKLEPRWKVFSDAFFSGLQRNALLYALMIVLVMAIAAFVVALQGIQGNRVQNDKLTAQVACQFQYNQINNERTRRLAVATDSERQAEEEADHALANFTASVVNGIPQKAQTQLFQELNEKLKAQQVQRDRGDMERKANPVPPPPEALCGPKPN
jgi:hypothetical protein